MLPKPETIFIGKLELRINGRIVKDDFYITDLMKNEMIRAWLKDMRPLRGHGNKIWIDVKILR